MVQDEKPKTRISHSMLPAMIERIEGRIKHIPADQIAALETVHMMLEMINSYHYWVNEFKKELIKCDNLNKAQAEMIKNLGGIKVVSQ